MTRRRRGGQAVSGACVRDGVVQAAPIGRVHRRTTSGQGSPPPYLRREDPAVHDRLAEFAEVAFRYCPQRGLGLPLTTGRAHGPRAKQRTGRLCPSPTMDYRARNRSHRHRQASNTCSLHATILLAGLQSLVLTLRASRDCKHVKGNLACMLRTFEACQCRLFLLVVLMGLGH